MKRIKDNLREQAGRQLSQFEAAPPELMWDRIRAGMHRRRRFILLRHTLVAATLLLLIGIGYKLIVPVPHSGNVMLSEQNLVSNPEDSLSGSSGKATDGSLSDAEPAITQVRIAMQYSGKKRVSAPLPQQAALTAETLAAEVIREADAALVHDRPETLSEIQGDEAVYAAETEIAEVVPVIAGNTPVIKENNLPQAPSNENVPDNGWLLALQYGTNPAIELTQQDYSLESNRGNYSLDAVSSGLAAETSYFDEVESTEHQAPFILGLIISKPFARRWAAESGLVYSRLGYLIRTTELNSAYREYRNELTYLGVPLGLRFNVIDGRRAGFFASQSFIFEKGISSRVTSSTYHSGLLNESANRHESISGFQISSLTGLGGELKFSGTMSIYGMAGMQCFFMNKSQPYNIRSARIAWPSFQAGIRIKIR